VSRNFEILHRGLAQADAFGARAVTSPLESKSARPKNRHGAADDEIAKLIQSLFICPATANPPSAVAFCGVNGGVGCSWVCARAGEALAGLLPGRICVVDANLRSPTLHDYFGAEVGPGFAEALNDPAPLRDFVRPTWCSHLWLMASGAVRTELNGGLNPDRLRSRLSELRAEFDYVLLDTPAVTSCPDAELMARYTDGVVLVVQSRSTHRASARAVKARLEMARIPILGAVLNRRTYPIPEALYRRF